MSDLDADPDPTWPEHVRANRAHWNRSAPEWVSSGERSWRATEPSWGIWGIGESELSMLPADMTGLNAIELGCGTGYVASWMARRGAAVVGIDISEGQLETARRLARQHGVDITLIHGSAEAVPRPDGAFDFAISEYGAAIWCDPTVWIPEAHRLLRPGGTLVFLGSTAWTAVCTPPSGAPCEPRLHRDYFGLHRIDWREVDVDPGGIEFFLSVPGWLRLFRETGFEVLDYLELQAPAEAGGQPFSMPASWAKRWPSEHVWKLRRAVAPPG